jgi:broad specificity phosphatase PhoE
MSAREETTVHPTTVVFETHSWSEDNERGIASGWRNGSLSLRGRLLAAELGERRRDGGFDVVLASDLRRAVETAEIAFDGWEVPVLLDWRLRECDYGDLNGQPAPVVHAAGRVVDERYPGGESWAQAIARVGGVIADIGQRWPAGRVLVIGHMSGYWALEHVCHGLPLTAVGGPFEWREGWTYELPSTPFQL